MSIAPNHRGDQPLHIAAKYSCPEVVEQLLDVGAEINAHDRDKLTPLQLAVAAGDKIDNARLLRIRGALFDVWSATALGDLDYLRSRPQDMLIAKGDKGNHAMPSLVGLALQHQESAVLDWLLEQGAEVNGKRLRRLAAAPRHPQQSPARNHRKTPPRRSRRRMA